ncbi:UNVERIFIED_CONTAM: hypothetical protein GTU68_064673, partial [Idotea baltica]|nr:hypothetical protein [Idotea baltica]
ELLCVTGGNRISGNIKVSGAKNAALPIIVAGLLSKETCVFRNVPDLEDIGVLMRLLRYLGASEAPYAAVKALRASFWVLGPLIARLGEASVALPGGDAIGTRPVDLHLRGLEKLIEAATYLAAAAMTGGEITVGGVSPDSLASTLDILRRSGCEVNVGEGKVTLAAPEKCKAVSFRTAPFPGVATDVQPILMALMCVSEGTSVIEENVFESRFGHVAAYRRFGAKITTRGRVATVEGVSDLSSVQVEGLDIRAAVGMVLMALCSEGTSQISEIHHIDRGYQDICGKLRSVGAQIVRLPAHESREVIFGC